MSDQCRGCQMRGDIKGCKSTECSHHENWMAIEQQKRIDKLEMALKIISEWHGHFPSTGKFYDDDPSRPVSYGVAYGSNGERNYMRALATKALSDEDL